MSLHGQQLIGLTRRSTDSTEQRAVEHRAVDPRSGQAIEPAFVDASQAQIDEAMTLAASAHAAASLADPERRASLLERIAAELEALGDALIERASIESGLPHARLLGERGRTCAQLRMFAAVVREGSWVGARIDRAQPDRQPLPRPELRRMLIPLGPVAVFGASNFPLAFSVAGGDTASALAAGCPVIAKAHPSHPGTSELVGEAIVAAVRAGELHRGCFALLHGAAHGVGQALVRHPSLAAVAFTGSLRGGRALFELAASRPTPIPVFAEMGSVNPVLLLPAALRERGLAIASAAAGSITLGVGQFCTNPGVMLVPAGPQGDAWIDALLRALASVEPGVMLDANILASYCAGTQQRAAQAGVTCLSPRAGTREGAPTRAEVAVFSCDAASFLADPSLHDELFGPSTLLVRWRDEEQLAALAASFEGQLSATIHADADDLALARRIMPMLLARVGRLVWNSFPTGVEVAPAMQHGGPWPASSDSRTSSVGSAAIERFARPICLQDLPAELLPPELRDDNPRALLRMIDGELLRG